MSGKKILSAIVLLLLCSSVLADESTLARYIADIQVDGTGTHYFRGSSAVSGSPVAWGIVSCPSATYVYTRDLAGQKDVLAAALTTATAGRPVTFFDTCDADSICFHATRVLVSF